MTTPEQEFTPGNENVFVAIFPHPTREGFVSLGIYRVEDQEYVAGIALPPETARDVAFNLTLASMKVEERMKE